MGRRDGRHSADARRPYVARQRCNVLARRQAGGVNTGRRDGATVGRRDERHSVDTQRPYGLRQRCSVLTGQQDGGVSIVG
jgi:hypothetical protein